MADRCSFPDCAKPKHRLSNSLCGDCIRKELWEILDKTSIHPVRNEPPLAECVMCGETTYPAYLIVRNTAGVPLCPACRLKEIVLHDYLASGQATEWPCCVNCERPRQPDSFIRYEAYSSRWRISKFCGYCQKEEMQCIVRGAIKIGNSWQVGAPEADEDSLPERDPESEPSNIDPHLR